MDAPNVVVPLGQDPTSPGRSRSLKLRGERLATASALRSRKYFRSPSPYAEPFYRTRRGAFQGRSQAQTAPLSPKGRQAIVQGSRHSIQNDRPHVVIAAVLEAMCEARADR
jgi:hypothetical protein